jgi:hypothetical protein
MPLDTSPAALAALVERLRDAHRRSGFEASLAGQAADVIEALAAEREK